MANFPEENFFLVVLYFMQHYKKLFAIRENNYVSEMNKDWYFLNN